MAKRTSTVRKEQEDREVTAERTPEETLRMMKIVGEELKERMAQHGSRAKNAR
jgi:hypothetical protein